MTFIKRLTSTLQQRTVTCLSTDIHWFSPPASSKAPCLVLFPIRPNTLSCGISSLVAFRPETPPQGVDIHQIQKSIEMLSPSEPPGGEDIPAMLLEQITSLKTNAPFHAVYSDSRLKNELVSAASKLKQIITRESDLLKEQASKISAQEGKLLTQRLELIKDAWWCLEKEILSNMDKIAGLSSRHDNGESFSKIIFLKKVNAVLNSLDRLEVRGRDSAGISLMLVFGKDEFEDFRKKLIQNGLGDRLKQRTNRVVMTNNSITISDTFPGQDEHLVSIAFVYKYAAEIGALGDNISFLRNQIKNDQILQVAAGSNFRSDSVTSHTRWASVGEITEANCHPVDNEPTDKQVPKNGIIHVSLNGDIDNYLDLKTEYEERYDPIHKDISTDTKIIPLQIEHYLRQGRPVEEAFRLAVCDFEGSHAVSMHTDLAPGKIFLAQKGSGQALFVGLAPDHYIAASELYGLVEETHEFIKLNGEKTGQIMILDQNSPGGIQGISSMTYDGTPIEISQEDIQSSEITSRDIDRQNYPHYFLKEIAEAPLSVGKTLDNRFRLDEESGLCATTLDKTVISEALEKALKNHEIKRIHFIGQGTAGIAAQGCANILSVHLVDTNLAIRAMKASELSGFAIKGEENDTASMSQDLVVAISQSGTTTDTNRTVDMVREKGAWTLAIVNRRDSDLTFKTDGVLYTSSGRDIEMSVASTKAFYSQITAGALLGLHIASILKAMTPESITREIKELLLLPEKMETILAMKDEIRESAFNLAVNRYYWATVGSGANKTSADEIRIKLSELCYKTISSDFVEDKKHIDLSSEPLILVCAAGTRESVLGDIIKDTAIFKAHKASPVVITDQGEKRFDPYAEDVFRIPRAPEHFAPILNTLVGHLWGYYAALAINEGSRFLYDSRLEIRDILDEYTAMGHDAYEVVLEKRFREKIAKFYKNFTRRRRAGRFPAAMGLDTVTNITLLLKYLSGRLPVSDFEIDFGRKGTPGNMLESLFSSLSDAINTMARPVDAIKHQAKTVTVGTSRIQEKFSGMIFDELAFHNISVSQLTNRNVLVIKNLQEIIQTVKGGLLYRITGLNLLGELTPETRIQVAAKTGNLVSEKSRVEKDHRLKGTKNIIVREGNVYIGRGRKDGRSILVIPVLSDSRETSTIEFILSLNVGFKSEVSLLKRIKALGGKYTRIKDTILESGITWDDKLLNLVSIEDLFGDSAEKLGDFIAASTNEQS